MKGVIQSLIYGQSDSDVFRSIEVPEKMPPGTCTGRPYPAICFWYISSYDNPEREGRS